MSKPYRKKPVVIEAIQYNGKNKVEIQRFMGRYLDEFVKGLKIPTLEGDMSASVGDYIIKGVHGEFYPCEPDIFEQTYEEIAADTINGAFGILEQGVTNIPAADVVEVKHGRWEEIRNNYGELEGWIHMDCGREVKAKENYCPKCGAKMDGGADND